MRESGDDTPRETPAAKGSDSRISVPSQWDSAHPPSSSSNPPDMDELTRRERRAHHNAITRAEGRAAVTRVKVHAGVAAVLVLAVTALVICTTLMLFVFAVGVGVAMAVGLVTALLVFLCGRAVLGHFNRSPRRFG